MGWNDQEACDRSMAADDDLLRWYFDERSSPAGTAVEAASTDFSGADGSFGLGVEAAQPALQMHLMRELRALQQR